MKKLIVYLIKFINVIRNKLLFLKSWLYTELYVDYGNGRIIFKTLSSKLKVKKSKTSLITLNGNLILEDIFHKADPILINLSNGSELNIDGDFILGNGVKIIIAEKGILNIGGRKLESGSGITADTIIMVKERIEIGVDFICAWNCFISDSDWHKTETPHNTIPVKLGNHIWIASNVLVLKGSNISDNTIISSGTIVHNQAFQKNQLLASVPAKIIKENIFWSRDLK